MDKVGEKIFMTIGFVLSLILGFIGVLIISSIVNGFVLTVLWGWFMVPVFALPTLGIAQAIGINMAINFITYQYIGIKGQKRETVEVLVELFGLLVLRPIFVLIFGYVVHLFV